MKRTTVQHLQKWLHCSKTECLSLDSVIQGPVAVPHLVPLLMVMEGEDPVENSDRGCQVLYDVLQSARSAALHAQDYQQHAHSLLTGAYMCFTSV